MEEMKKREEEEENKKRERETVFQRTNWLVIPAGALSTQSFIYLLTSPITTTTRDIVVVGCKCSLRLPVHVGCCL